MTTNCATLTNNTLYFQNERILSQRVLKDTSFAYHSNSSTYVRFIQEKGVDLLERVSEINGRRVSYQITAQGSHTEPMDEPSPTSSAFASFLAVLVCLIAFLIIFL